MAASELARYNGAMRVPSIVAVCVAVLCVSSSCLLRPALADYDAACAQDSDCAVVSSACSWECNCGSGALSANEAERFDADVDAYCAWQPPPVSVVQCDCVELAARCADGACVMCEVEDVSDLPECG